MSRMSLIEGRVRGPHLAGISFSVYSTPHVPIALVHGDSAYLDTRSFHSSPANVLEFIHRTCISNLRPFREATLWGDGILKIGVIGFELAVPKIEGNNTDQMSFRMETLYSEDEDADTLLRAEMEYQSPAFYLFQFVEFPLTISDFDLAIKAGTAATLIVGGMELFQDVADRYDLPLHENNLSISDAAAIANNVAHHEMILNESNSGYASTSGGYGISYDGSIIDDTPDLSVKFSSNGTKILTLHGHELEFGGPSIALLQNISISAYGIHGSVEPIVRDLMYAAARMCSTLPLTDTI